MEIRVTAPEALPEMEISQTLHLLPWRIEMRTEFERGSDRTNSSGEGEGSRQWRQKGLAYRWSRWARKRGGLRALRKM